MGVRVRVRVRVRGRNLSALGGSFIKTMVLLLLILSRLV